MSNDLVQEKKILRTKLLNARNALSASFCEDASRRIAGHVKSFFDQYTWRKVLIFNSIGNEPKTQYIVDIIANSAVIAMPRVDSAHKCLVFHRIRKGEGLRKGVFGIEEPMPSAPIEVPEGKDHTLIVVPALAFDMQGYRLGYGGGFYDRYLTQHGQQAQVIGIGYHHDIQMSLPHAEFDQAVPLCITERGITFFQ